MIALVIRRRRRIATPERRLLLAMATVAPPAGLLLLGLAFDNTPIELRYLAFATPFIGLLLAAALPPRRPARRSGDPGHRAARPDDPPGDYAAGTCNSDRGGIAGRATAWYCCHMATTASASSAPSRPKRRLRCACWWSANTKRLRRSAGVCGVSSRRARAAGPGRRRAVRRCPSMRPPSPIPAGARRVTGSTCSPSTGSAGRNERAVRDRTRCGTERPAGRSDGDCHCCDPGGFRGRSDAPLGSALAERCRMGGIEPRCRRSPDQGGNAAALRRQALAQSLFHRRSARHDADVRLGRRLDVHAKRLCGCGTEHGACRRRSGLRPRARCARW